MSTRQELDSLLEKKQKWMDLYDRCAICLKYLTEEFGGRKEFSGDVCSRMTKMRAELSGGGGFWQGPDADTFSRRLEELGTAIQQSEESFRSAILKIQNRAVKKTDDYNEKIRVCYEQMDYDGQASLWGDAIWDTIVDIVTGG